MATLFVFAAILLLLHFYMPTLSIAALRYSINTDQSSLLTFKNHISDPNHILSKNWSSASSVCYWIGITCSSSHQRVTGLNLSHMGLVGTLPSHLGNLSFLADLDLSNNSFNGSLPNDLAQLRRLKQIFLQFNDFSGEIPSWFLLLRKLQVLSVWHNSFSGAIPSFLFNMTSLQQLDLSYNKLSGILPLNIFNSSSLHYLDVEDNFISGSIPLIILNNSPLQLIGFTTNHLSGEFPSHIFDHLPNLKSLYLSDNQFSGNLPLSMFNCKQLEVLSLSVNKFEGGIPPAIGNLTMIKEIYLGYNNFLQGACTIPNEIVNLQNLEIFSAPAANLSGKIPASVFNISALKEINLYDNQLSDGLPSSLGSKLANLEVLLLWRNYLSGKLPNSLGNATKLRSLGLNHNLFSGYIPDIFSDLINLKLLNLGDTNLVSKPSDQELSFMNSLTHCKYLRYLAFYDSPLNSILPISIGNLSTSLEHMDFQNCKIKGSIPASIGNLSGLLYISLAQNQLTGSIPTEMGKLQNLQGLILFSNYLEGVLPLELCRLKHLDILDLANNSFNGPIPIWLGNISTLSKLWLSDNAFNWTLPSTLWDLSNLMYLYMESNQLSGSLAPEISNLKVVIEVSLSKNKLSGGIPSSIGELQNLQNLSLDQNNFEGHIPQSLGNLVSLELLNLSKNNLSGIIPKSLENLVYLKSFNVSFNELEGEIPIGGRFTNFSIQSFMGNKELCGASHLHFPKCKAPLSRQSPKAIALKYVLPIAIPTMLLLTFIYVLLKCQTHKRPLISGVDATIATWRRISYNELQQATNGFIDANLLATGNFGKVYKGVLSDGMNVAIKVFNLEQEGEFSSFETECEVLSNVLHRNLIKIISCCSNIDFKALVLSYMSNGSLEKWLHSHDHYLSIIQRLNILIDTAAALDYLHHGCSIPIVHCDLKPNNILLDEDMVAHVTDFGISKLINRGDSITQTMTLATMGYMAPEYGLEGIVSRHGDVYSYGILLMEMFTQKKPLNEMFKGEFSIKQWVKESYPDRITNVIDAKLLTGDKEQFAISKDCFISVMGLALDCVAESPNERKNIKEVLVALEKIKMRFLNEARHGICH